MYDEDARGVLYGDLMQALQNLRLLDVVEGLHHFGAELVDLRVLKPAPRGQGAWKGDHGSAGERGGARAGKLRCVRILTITAGSSMRR